MTPTERAAFAAAIAALDEISDPIGAAIKRLNPDERLTKDAHAILETVPHLKNIARAALASLRAAAPADQSAVAETGVEEFLFDWSSFPKEIYVRSVMSRHLMTEFRCVAAKLSAEPEVKYLRSDLAPSSDAGRDGVIEASK